MNWVSRYTPRRTRSENAKFVVDGISKLGFKIHSASRIGRMHRVLTTGSEIVDRKDPQFETALEAERDLQMLGFILDVLQNQLVEETFRHRFESVLNDTVLPQQNLEHSPGRDAQFEFYIAAICEKAGMRPVLLEEPDITCCVKGKKFGVAAKRIKNASKLETRIREAANQIETTKLPGFIAIDTCVALNRGNDRITTPMVDEVFMRIHKRALYEFVKHFHDRIQEWVRGKGVRGIIVHDEQIRYLEGNSWAMSGMTLWLDTTRFNARRSKEYSLFEERYKLGIPNAEDI